MKLKYLLILVFIIVAAVPLFLSLYYLNKQSGQYYREQMMAHLEAISYMAKKQIISSVNHIEESSRLIASRTQLRRLLKDFEQGKVDTAERLKVIIQDAQASAKLISFIKLYDQRGHLVTTSDTLDKRFIEDDTKLESRSSQSIKIINKANEVFLLVRSPLLTDSNLVGFLEIYYSMNFLKELVTNRVGLGKTGEWLFVIRGEGGDAIFPLPLKYDSNAPFNRVIPRDRIEIPATQALLGNEVILENAPDYRGEPVLASTRYLPELDWGLVAKIDESEVTAIIETNNRSILFLELLVITLSIFTGILLSFYISRPIENLKKHTSEVARGKFREHSASGGWDEVKELTNNFNIMVKALREFNLELSQKVTERTKALNDANKRLTMLAITDPLTSLYNRRYFIEKLTEEIDRAKRYQEALSLVLLDIDHFKQVNDKYGHQAGDEALVQLAHLLKETVRASDCVARLGGEEFGIIIPKASAKSVDILLNRIRYEIEEHDIRSGDVCFNFTCSFGVSQINDIIDSFDKLYDTADKALYHAKAEGRNRVVFYQASEASQEEGASN